VSTFLKLSQLGLELRVNGTEIDSVQLRPCGDPPIEFDLVVRDSMLGAFAVHRAFTFEVRGAGAGWRRVTMGEALEEIAAADRLLDIEAPHRPSGTAERKPSDGSAGTPTPHRRRRRARMGEEGAHVLHAEEVLYSAGIPHLLLPVQRDRFSSNTFMVPSVPKAKIALCRGGFRQALPSGTVLVHVRSGRAIRLIEPNGNAGMGSTESAA
jgi:hypothetical protein